MLIGLNIDNTTRDLINELVDHKVKGDFMEVHNRHNWQTPPNFAIDDANVWVAKDTMLSSIIGDRLTKLALEQHGQQGYKELYEDLVKNTRDDYHTMDELYEYRMLYNAIAANSNPHISVKSLRHSDGEVCFGGEWFIVVMSYPFGQVSNHYPVHHWDLFNIPTVHKAPQFDGHTPKQAANRLLRAARSGKVYG